MQEPPTWAPWDEIMLNHPGSGFSVGLTGRASDVRMSWDLSPGAAWNPDTFHPEQGCVPLPTCWEGAELP